MDTIEAIKTRRSIRKYTDKPVADEDISKILDCGFCAPNAHNLKPWDFIVVKEREKLNSFADYGTYQKMLYKTQVAIIVCGDSEKQTNHDLLVNDCSAATENILLAAHSLGLGAVWCGIVQDSMIKFFTESLNLPKNVVPMALISIGYPDEERHAPERYNKERVHFGSYGITN